MRSLRFICVFIILLANGLNAQERVFKFFSNKDGLPSNNIFKIRFDQKGFLWIAHDKGISRFDGNTFKNYSNPLQKSNVYTDLLIDKNGKVWMSNLGLQIFCIIDDEMVLYKSFDLKLPPSALKMTFLNNGNMVVNAQGGLTEIDMQSGTEYVTSIGGALQYYCKDKDDVYFVNPYTRKLHVYHNKTLDTIGYNLNFPPLLVNKNVILSTYNNSSKLNVYVRRTGKSSDIDLGHNFNFSEISDGRLLLYTNGNIHQIFVNGDTVRSHILMSGHSYTHMTVDALGNEWYSTLNEGIIFIPVGNCKRLSKDGGTGFLRLVQFRNAAYCMSIDNKLFRVNKNGLTQIGEFNTFLNKKPIILIKNLQNKQLVIGNSRFMILDSNLAVRPYFPELAMKDICIDKNRFVYFATPHNVYKHPTYENAYQRIAKSITFFGLEDFMYKYPIIGRFNCVEYDTMNSTFYYGGVPGFFRQEDGKIAIEVKDGGNAIYTSILDYCKPYILVGTIQAGIYIMKDGKILHHLYSKNSTLGNTIIKIKHYGNSIWVLSEKGLHNINLKTFQAQSYATVGAVSLNNCTDFTISQEQLYLVLSQDLYSVDLNEFIKSISPVPVFFSSVNAGGKTVFNLSNLSYPYAQNSLVIAIQIPATMVLGNAEFEYSLNQNQWVTLNKGQSEIFLNQLSPGTYTLNVRQKGMEKLYTLKFAIEKPYWMSWWFYALIILFASWVIVFLYRNRIRVIREKSRTEIEKFKLEKALQQNILSSIKSQMNPHFLFNALNTIQSYIYLNDKKQAIGYLGKFSVLTRKILDQSNHETITLSEEHETLDLYLQLEKMRFENTLEYTFSFENIPFKDQFRVPPMLIQPYVENAVKHGLMHKPDKRRLHIRIKYNEPQNLIEVYVDDNGIGRKKAMEINEKRGHTHKPFSTEANRTRLEILNNENQNPISVQITDKTDEYGNSTGTMVQINIPVL